MPSKITDTVELVELWTRGDLTSDQIGARLGVSGSTVRRYAMLLDLTRRKKQFRRNMSDTQRRLFLSMWESGVRSEDIAKLFDISVRSVGYVCEMLGAALRRPGAATITLAEYREQLLGEAMRRAPKPILPGTGEAEGHRLAAARKERQAAR